MEMMEYKDYVGSIEFSEEDNVFYGKVQNVGGLISYEGETEGDLYVAFCGAVDDFLTL
ncbi:MAG: antitoxin HicB [Peptococcaceae bacterium]|nr:antitoxin HicB [Peptococcaceae bacterium]